MTNERAVPKKIMRPEDVPPVGSVVRYTGTGIRIGEHHYSVVVGTEGFGSALHLCGMEKIFEEGSQYSTVGTYHMSDPDQWPDEVCAAFAKWRLTT